MNPRESGRHVRKRVVAVRFRIIAVFVFAVVVVGGSVGGRGRRRGIAVFINASAENDLAQAVLHRETVCVLARFDVRVGNPGTVEEAF